MVVILSVMQCDGNHDNCICISQGECLCVVGCIVSFGSDVCAAEMSVVKLWSPKHIGLVGNSYSSTYM